MKKSDLLYLPYSEARSYIKEGDVLLFRGKKWYSYIIKKFTKSSYSHAALASWHNGSDEPPILELIEFHAMTGGAISQLSRSVKKYSGTIDIYRPSRKAQTIKWNVKRQEAEVINIEFDGKKLTRTMRMLAGLPYGIMKIILMAQKYAIFARLFGNIEKMEDDTQETVSAPVCSTSVAHCFNSVGYDLVKNKADKWTEPGDLACSPSLNYLFTLEFDADGWHS